MIKRVMALACVQAMLLLGIVFPLKASSAQPDPLSIKVLYGPAETGKCGGAEFIVKWDISLPKNGWIIQHVKFVYDTRDSDGNPLDDTNTKASEFWEAWRVKGGKVYRGDSDLPHELDRFRLPPNSAMTRGLRAILGNVKFVEGYKLDTAVWTRRHPVAPGLPVTFQEPKGWPTIPGKSHELRVEWNCCEEPNTMKVNSEPKSS